MRKVLVSCILVLFFTTGLSGCTVPTGEDIAAEVIDTYSTVNSYRFSEQSTAAVNVMSGHARGMFSLSQNTTSNVDISHRKAETSIMQVGQPLYPMRSSIRSYLLNERLYIKRDVLDYEDPDHEIWVRLHLDDEELNENDRLWNTRNPLGTTVDLLATAEAVILAGDETKDGEVLYVIDVTPEPEGLRDWLLSQPPWNRWRSQDFTENADPFLFRMWISAKTLLIHEVELRSGDERLSSVNGTGITAFHSVQTFDAYNESFDIILPEEAMKAVRGPIS